MDDRIAKLKIHVRALHRGRVASRVRYSEDLRREIALGTPGPVTLPHALLPA